MMLQAEQLVPGRWQITGTILHEVDEETGAQDIEVIDQTICVSPGLDSADGAMRARRGDLDEGEWYAEQTQARHWQVTRRVDGRAVMETVALGAASEDSPESALAVLAEAENPDPAEAAAWDAGQYLAATDWYIVRQAETGKPVPPDILAARAAAREIA